MNLTHQIHGFGGQLDKIQPWKALPNVLATNLFCDIWANSSKTY